MKVLQIRIFFVVNCLLFQVYENDFINKRHDTLHDGVEQEILVILGELDWIVNVKVSGFGEHLTLFCLIDDCCTKEAGWVKFDPDYKTIFLDVRNSKNYTSTDKYAATTNSTGFSLTIKNIQKEDINIEYACVYGFVQSRTKLLNQSDAFRDDETRSELPVIEIIIGSSIGSIVILVAVVVFVLKFKQYTKRRKRYADIYTTVACSSEKDQSVWPNISNEKEEMSDLLNVPDGEITQPVAKPFEKDIGVDILHERKERMKLLNGITSVQDWMADFVIIHTEDKHQMHGVESYKCHLKQLTEEMGSSSIIIKLFEEVFLYEYMSSGVEIRTVLAKCHYVFVYISENFFPSKLKRFGINECWIHDAFEKQESNLKRRIKIVSNCASCELPKFVKPDTVFLNYFDYERKKGVDKYQQNVRELLRKMHMGY